MAHLAIPESLDKAEVEEFYDLTAVWLRDCTRKNNVFSTRKAEANLREVDAVLAEKFGEA